MSLTLLGWLNGISASCTVISGWCVGSLCIYKSRKTNAKVLFYMGLFIFFLGMTMLGSLYDLLSILFTGKNIDNSYGLFGILNWMWVAPIVITAGYLGAELMIPKHKKFILSVYLILGIIFELFLFLDTMGSTSYIYPKNPGEDIIDAQIVITSPAGILTIIFLLSGIILIAFGFFIKGIQSTGVIRKKFWYLSMGYIIWVLAGSVEALAVPVIASYIVRFLIVVSFLLLYFGIKEITPKSKELSPELKGELEEAKITLIQKLAESRPEEITEKEILNSKEEKICLVCKNKTLGFNLAYICPKCNTIYCEKCARTLSTKENACWVCFSPFDESKPVKLPKKEMEKIFTEKYAQKKGNTQHDTREI